jgi:radical SAM protein with 4Fe4S-binding SPASM domain
LSADEQRHVADQLVALRIPTVVLTGGEPMLSPGWERIARRLADGGVRVRLFTSGYAFDAEALRAALDAGVSQFAVSLDGPKPVHDDLRPVADAGGRSSFDEAVSAIERIVAAGADLRVVTQVNRVNVGTLDAIYESLRDRGVRRWQVQLCQMAGRARDDRDELAADPRELETIVRVLLRAARERKVLAPLHCTVGYMTREEPVLRGREVSRRAAWRGCRAGKRTLAITADGGVKGCTSLPDEFVTASVRERPLADIWADDRCFPYTRTWSGDALGGACAKCPFGTVCRAGCPAVAYGATGSIGVNPYCLRLVRAS